MLANGCLVTLSHSDPLLFPLNTFGDIYASFSFTKPLSHERMCTDVNIPVQHYHVLRFLFMHA